MNEKIDVSERHMRTVLNNIKSKVWRFGSRYVDRNEEQTLKNDLANLFPALFIRHERLYTKSSRKKTLAVVLLGLDIAEDEDLEEIKEYIRIFKELK